MPQAREREDRELLVNGYWVSVWEDGKSSGDGWWHKNVSVCHAAELNTENGKFYVVFVLPQLK